MPASAPRVFTVLAIAGIVAAAMTACAPEKEPATSATPTASATATQTPTPTPTATATAEPESTPVEIDCNTLITPQAIYDFNPNFVLNDTYEPADGTEAADIVKLKGVACAWVNQTSGEVIEVAVANLPTDSLTALKNDFVMHSNSVPTYGVEGYFQVDGSIGEAEAFGGPYWISATSAAFFEPGDAVMIVKGALAGLGQ